MCCATTSIILELKSHDERQFAFLYWAQDWHRMEIMILAVGLYKLNNNHGIIDAHIYLVPVCLFNSDKLNIYVHQLTSRRLTSLAAIMFE